MAIRIQLLVYPGFTLLDLVGPAQLWKFWPGADLQYVWKQPGAVDTDTGMPVVATTSFDDAWETTDIFFVPGGMHPTFELLDNSECMDFVASRAAGASWITSVCTGAFVLGGAGLLKNRKATTHWFCYEDLARFGAIPTEGRYVIDRNADNKGGIATGGGVTAGIDFGLALVAEMSNDDTARLLQLLVEYAPQPPFASGHPHDAKPETVAQANQGWAEFKTWLAPKLDAIRESQGAHH